MISENRLFDLSPVQKQTWINVKDEALPYLTLTVRIMGTLDLKRIGEAWKSLFASHNALKTVYISEAEKQLPKQLVLDGLEPDISSGDASFFFTKEDAREMPSVRVFLKKDVAGSYLLIIGVAAVSCDATSLINIFEELCGRYTSGSEFYAPEIIKYTRYSKWQNELCQHPATEAVDFWEKRSAVKEGKPHNWIMEPGMAKENVPGSVSGTLSADLYTGIRALASDVHVAPASVFAAAWLVLCHYHTSSENIVIGEVNNKRSYDELKPCIGRFSKTLPLPMLINSDESFTSFLGQINQARTDNEVWEDYYDGCLDYTIGFEYLQVGGSEGKFPAFSIAGFSLPIAPFGLKLNCIHYTDCCDLELGFSDSCMDTYTGSLLLDQYIKLLTSVVSRKEERIGDLNALPDDQEVMIRETFNKAALNIREPSTVLRLFDEQVSIASDAIALVYKYDSLSFAALNGKINRLANYLLENGWLKSGDRVIVKMPRSEYSIISLLAVLRAGCTYVPVDHHIPEKRLCSIIDDCKPVMILTDDTEQERGGLVPQLSVQEGLNSAATSSALSPDIIVLPSAIAYIIYTSGSTGVPKGVLVTHSNLCNYVLWCRDAFSIGAQDSTLLFSSISFDLCYTSLWTSLIAGATLYILEESQNFDPENLIRNLIFHKITFIKCTPSHLHMLVNDPAFDEHMPQYALRLVISGGEPLNYEDMITLMKRRGDINFVNHYGPTETTVGAIAGPLDLETLERRNGQVLGRPIDGDEVYLFNRIGQLSPVGIPGQIGIAGRGLTKGYLNKEELTKARFIEHPFSPGQRIYMTGDMGRWLPSGVIEYLGRQDFQVKIRGFRVELSEIENTLLLHPGINQVVVIAAKDQENELTAYYKSKNPLIKDNICSFLKDYLPDYMIPARFVRMAEIPLMPNGKVNRAALLVTAEGKSEQRPLLQRTLSPLEKDLTRIVSQVLNVENVDIYDDFFERGANSLKAVRLVVQIFKQLKSKLTLKDIFGNANIVSLASLIGGRKKEYYEEIHPVPAQESYELSHAQRRLWILCKFEDASQAYNMVFSYSLQKVEKELLEMSIYALMERHEILRTIFIVREGGPMQKVLPFSTSIFSPGFVDLRGLENREEEVNKHIDAERKRLFDLEKKPPVSTMLLQVDDDNWVFIVNAHHIVSDGWSGEVLAREMRTIYNALKKGKTADLPFLKIQYKDYSVYQNKLLNDGQFHVHKQYWLEQFGQPVPVLRLPTDFQRPAFKTYNGSQLVFSLSKRITGELTAFSQQTGVTLFMTLTAIINTMLFRFSDLEDIVVGIPVAGRVHASLEDQIGFYVNMLPLRVRFSRHDSFMKVLGTTRDAMLNALQHQVYPFDRLVEELELERDPGRSPLFDITVQLKTHEALEVYEDSYIVIRRNEEGKPGNTSQFDLSFYFSEEEHGLLCTLEYNTDIFKAESIIIIKQAVVNLIQAVLKDPEEELTRLYLLPFDLLEEFITKRISADVRTSRPGPPLREVSYLPAGSQLEHKLLNIWQEILERKGIGILDNFFTLGGHSLKATWMIYRIYKELNVNIDLRSIFNNPTIESLARHLTDLGYQSFQPIPVLEPQSYYRLSHAQERLWVLSQHEEEQLAYIVSGAYALLGELELEAFEKAFIVVTARHEILRTTFKLIDGQLRQQVHSASAFPPYYTYSDLRGQPDNEKKVMALYNQEVNTCFDLGKGPLWRARLSLLKDNTFIFTLITHHIITDGWSDMILIRDVLLAYNAACKGDPVPFKPLPIQYKDFAAWQNDLLEGPKAEIHRDFWTRQFLDGVPKLTLPLDFERPAVKLNDAVREVLYFSDTLSNEWRLLTEKNGTTLFMSLMALLNAFLYYVTGNKDIIIGSPVSGREHPDTQDQIGVYINTLPLRCRLREDQTFKDLLLQVEEISSAAFEHQVYPFEQIIEDLGIQRDYSRSMLFDVGFTWLGFEGIGGNVSGGSFDRIQVRPIVQEWKKVKTDIWFHAWEEEGRIAFSFTYNRALFRQETIQRMMCDFLFLSDHLTKNSLETLLRIAAETDLHGKEEIARSQVLQREMSLKKFIKKSVVNTGKELTRVSFLDAGENLLQVINPVTNDVVLKEWVDENHQYLSGLLEKQGAILFRGFGVHSAEEIRNLVSGTSIKSNEEGDQSFIIDRHFPYRTLNIRDELSYMPKQPRRLLVFCSQPFETPAEMPIADGRNILRFLSSPTYEKFRKQGLLITANLSKETGLSWQKAYKTEDRDEVERYCRAHDIEFEWGNKDSLYIRWKCPAIRIHSQTKEAVWFNGFPFNIAGLGLGAQGSGEGRQMPLFNIFYGSGQEIEENAMGELIQAYERSKAVFTWENGDVLLMDSTLMAYGDDFFADIAKSEQIRYFIS